MLSPARAGGLALALLSLASGPLAGQQGGDGEASPAARRCAAGEVARIDVRNHSLFAPEELDAHAFGWALGLVNWVHVRTRDHYLKRELLLEEGGCFSSEALAESERLIRDLGFIARVQTRSRLRPDSTWAVHVETWDEWTTQVGIDLDVENELQLKGFFAREKNLLGRGLYLSFRYRDFEERKDRSLALGTPRLFGTRTDASLAVGATRTGRMVRQTVAYPFVSESSRWAFDGLALWEDREQAYLTERSSPVTHALLPFSDVVGHARVLRRFGRPGALTLVGGGLELVHRERSGGPLAVLEEDFDEPVPAPDALAARLSSQARPDSHLKIGATVGLRRLRFTTAVGLDRVTGAQTVALGTHVETALGRSLTTFGSSSAFTWGGVEAFASARTGGLLGLARLSASGRVLDRSVPEESPWRDLSADVEALTYLQPGGSTTHTFLVGVRARLRANQDAPWQTVLGGEEGVRSYPEDRWPVGSRLVGFAEQRLNLDWFAPAVDFGLTAFADLGRGWASGVPFGMNTGWRAAAGGGIRLGFPAGSGSIAHLEMAWPVGDPLGTSEPVFRAYWAPTPTRR